MRIRLPLDTLLESISDIGDFPYDPDGDVSFDKPTLFIKGALSKYINRKNIPAAQSLFPNSRVHIVEDAGHWGMRDSSISVVATLNRDGPSPQRKAQGVR